NVGMPRDQFYSYSAAYDTLYYHGYYAGGTSYVYYVPLPYFVFPMNYSDSVSVSRPITNANGTIQTGSVNRNWKYDGFGTIKFPYGIENNVYRIHSYQIDSLVVNGIFISATTTEELLWIKQSDGIPVLRFQKQGASSLYAWYATASGGTSISEFEETQLVSIYPNPSNGSIRLRAEKSLEGSQYKILDYFGRVVCKGTLIATHESIDVRNLSAGSYLFQIEESKPLKFKIIQQ
ncbi:MAG: Secretion system C-terminal sorting domain, partial [Bacteroidota bacterium]